MKNNFFILFLLVSLLKATTGFSATHTVTATGSLGTYAFSPVNTSANVGDTIIFVLASVHSALEVSQATWNANSNVPLNGGFAVPFGGGMTVVTIAQTYYYVCQNHYSMGMKGTIVVSGTTGINTLHSAPASLEIFPNPVSGGATIKTGLAQGKENQMRIFDISGKCIYQKDNIPPLQYIDLSAFPSGIYLVAVKSEDLFLEEKLVVSK